VAISSRWLDALQEQFLAEQAASPYDPRFGVDAAPSLSGMRMPDAVADSPDMGGAVGASSGLAPEPGSSSYLDQVASGFAHGGVGGGLASFFADPNADRSASGANAWDMFRGITKSIGRAIGSAYGNPNFGLAAQRVEQEGAYNNALMERAQAETEQALREQAEKRARGARIMAATEGLNPTKRADNDEAVRRLSALGEYEAAKQIAGLLREDGAAKPPQTRTIDVGMDQLTQEWDAESGTWKDIATGPRFNPRSGQSTNVTVSPRIIMPGHNEPTTATETAMQGKTITSNDMIARLNDTAALYNPAYQQLGTKAEMWASNWTEKLGGSLSAEDADKLERYSSFRSAAFDNLSQTLKEMSGAAVTPQEYERLKQSLPDPGTGITGSGDGPTVFEAKLKRAIRSQKLALIRYGYAQRFGIPVDGIPLDLSTLKQRVGEAAEKEALAAGKSQAEAEAIAVKTVKQEFGGF